MAVRVQLGGRGLPRRMAAASFPIASQPVRAFGGWYHRVTNSNGTVPLPAQGSPTQRPVPDGPTPGHSFATPVILAQWSIVRPSLPRNAPWAGGIPHGIPGVTYTPAIGSPVQGQTPNTILTGAKRKRTIHPKGPVAQARITTNPKPVFFWKKQGGGGFPA